MEELAFWRNVALVILAIQGLLVLVLVLALNYGIVRLIDIVHRKSAQITLKAQQVSRTVAVRTDAYADRVTQPIVATRARATRMRTTIQSIVGRRRRSAVSGSTPAAAGPQ